jgi:hypothetical protein
LPRLGFLVGVVVALLVVQAVPASADSPTPSPIAPYSVRIFVNHTLRGAPFLAPIHPINKSYVDGQYCSWNAEAVVSLTLQSFSLWPRTDYPPCNAVGVPIQLCVTRDLCSDSILFDGHDGSTELKWPEDTPAVIARFRGDQGSTSVHLTSWRFSVDGASCAGGGIDATLDGLAIPWPLTQACSTPDQTVDALFKTDHGELRASFVWNGGSEDFDVSVPEGMLTATATPTTVPKYSAKIAVHYTYRGIPAIALAEPIGRATVDGVGCVTNTNAVVFESIVGQTVWPWRDGPPCNVANSAVRLCIFVTECSEEFVFDGSDEEVELRLPEKPTSEPGHSFVVGHFVHDGVPQTVSITAWKFVVGNFVCSIGWIDSGGSLPAVVSEIGRTWPTSPQCESTGSPVNVTFTTQELGDLEGTFVWDGSDVDYEIETGAFLQTATPAVTSSVSPSAAATPGSLPQAGGSPGSRGAAELVGLVGFGLLLFMVSVRWVRRGAHGRRHSG